MNIKPLLATIIPAQPLAKHLAFLLFCVALIALGMLPEVLVESLELQPLEPLSYRWFSAHYVHLGAVHAWMNVGGSIVLWLLVVAFLPSRILIVLLLFLPFFISLGLTLGAENAMSYRGFSGAIYGFYAAGVIWYWWENRGFCFLIGLFLIGKIILEQMPNFDNTYLLSSIGGLVAVDSHLWGAVGGTVIAAFFLLGARLGIKGFPCPWRDSNKNID
jgi:rhomboid family GlyGly-CTERM serine protease